MSLSNAPTDPARVLIAHNHWANEQFYSACAKLSNEQFHQSFDLGVGSLHENLIHILSWTRIWTDVMNEEKSRPNLEAKEKIYTIADLQHLNTIVSAEFETAAMCNSFDDILRPNKSLVFTRGGLVSHVTTHAVHHRAQCLSMFRQLGVKKLPKSSVYEWMQINYS